MLVGKVGIPERTCPWRVMQETVVKVAPDKPFATGGALVCERCCAGRAPGCQARGVYRGARG